MNTSNSITPNYRYSTQGQEKQTETGWSSYRWRNYDAAMGRFFNVDPLAETYHNWSTYAFSGNRVVDARELEGLEPKKVNEVSLPDDPVEFAEFIGGGINSIRAAFSNNVIRTVNTVTNNSVNKRYQVENDGSLTLLTGVPKESFKEKVVNGSFDLATLGIAVLGGPEGVLMGKGSKAPTLKALEEIKSTVKVGSKATLEIPKPPKGKGSVPPAQRDKKRVWTKNERAKMLDNQDGLCPQCRQKKTVDEVDAHHIKRHADGGPTDMSNGAAVCKPCHKELHR